MVRRKCNQAKHPSAKMEESTHRSRPSLRQKLGCIGQSHSLERESVQQYTRNEEKTDRPLENRHETAF